MCILRRTEERSITNVSLAHILFLSDLLYHSLLVDVLETTTTTLAIENVEADTRREYEEAIELAPTLVRKETQAIDFLRTEGYDPLRGAVRLSLYWKYRKALFRERWLLPMTQSGRGALNTDDVELLQTGYMFIIPRPNQGPLLMMDASKLHRTAGYSGTRILFYLFTVFVDYFVTTEGVTVVCVVSSSYSKRPPIATEKVRVGASCVAQLSNFLFLLELFIHCLFTSLFEQNVVNMGVQALPLRVKSFHIVRTHEIGKEILLETYAYNEALVYQYQTGLTPEMVAGDSVKGVLVSMQERGVERLYLPQILGGEFGDSHFQDWVRMRLSIEDILQGLPTTTTTINKTFFPAYAVATKANHMMKADQSPPMVSSNKLLLPNQSEQVNQPANTVEVAASDDSEIPTQRPGESRKDFLRRRNTFYVRRGNRKINQQIKSMQREVENLESHNQRLRASNRRLEASLAQARLVVAVAANNGNA